MDSLLHLPTTWSPSLLWLPVLGGLFVLALRNRSPMSSAPVQGSTFLFGYWTAFRMLSKYKETLLAGYQQVRISLLAGGGAEQKGDAEGVRIPGGSDLMCTSSRHH